MPNEVVAVVAGDAIITVGVGQHVQPIRYDFTKAGKYTLVVTGQFQAGQVASPSYFSVDYDLSMQGLATGDSAPAYQVTTSGQQVTINQTLSVDLTGAGPWQARIHCKPYAFGGTLTNITLRIIKG